MQEIIQILSLADVTEINSSMLRSAAETMDTFRSDQILIKMQEVLISGPWQGPRIFIGTFINR